MTASEQPAVMSLKLDPGHWKTLIDRMSAYLVDQRRDLVCYVERKEFDAALKAAIEIRETEFWIEIFEEEMDYRDDEDPSA